MIKSATFYNSLITKINDYLLSQEKTREELPYLVQFGPTIYKRRKYIPLLSRANPWIEYWWLTEYDKTAIDKKIPNRQRIQSITFPAGSGLTYNAVISHPDYHKLEYPLMIKPIQGERWLGIYFIDNEKALNIHFEKVANKERKWYHSYIQEYCTYQEEYCIQFYKYYNQDGDIEIQTWWLSLRDIPTVQWNSKDTILQLIQQSDRDTRHNNNIIKRLEENQENFLHSIPESWTTHSIVRTASIEYWTKYITIHLTEKQEQDLLTVIKKLTKHLEPSFICAWRFDIKAPSLEALLSWDCKVIECNAGWWIPTVVYDSALSVHEKYHLLDNHFSKLVAIAQSNKKNPDIKLIHKHGWWRYFCVIRQSFLKKWISFFQNNKKIREIIKTYKSILLQKKQKNNDI